MIINSIKIKCKNKTIFLKNEYQKFGYSTNPEYEITNKNDEDVLNEIKILLKIGNIFKDDNLIKSKILSILEKMQKENK